MHRWNIEITQTRTADFQLEAETYQDALDIVNKYSDWDIDWQDVEKSVDAYDDGDIDD